MSEVSLVLYTLECHWFIPGNPKPWCAHCAFGATIYTPSGTRSLLKRGVLGGLCVLRCLNRISCPYKNCQRKCAIVNTTPILYLSNPDLLQSVSLHGIYGPRECCLAAVHKIKLRNRLCLSKNPVARLFQECDNPDFPNPSVRAWGTEAIITSLR